MVPSMAADDTAAFGDSEQCHEDGGDSTLNNERYLKAQEFIYIFFLESIMSDRVEERIAAHVSPDCVA